MGHPNPEFWGFLRSWGFSACPHYSVWKTPLSSSIKLLIPSFPCSSPAAPPLNTAAALWENIIKEKIINNKGFCFFFFLLSLMLLLGLELHLSSKEAPLRRAHVLFRALKPFLIVFQTNNTEHNKTPLVQGRWHGINGKGKTPQHIPRMF